MKQESLPRPYKLWLIASLIILVGSLVLLAGAVVAAFITFYDKLTPTWVIALGALAVFGIVLGFGGLIAMMGIAGWRSFREARRVQVLPPESKTTL